LTVPAAMGSYHQLMHGDSILATLALLIAINAMVLSLARPILPSAFRPSLFRWQVGTFAIAGGFAASALESVRTRPTAAAVVSVLVATGLTCYYQALQTFRGQKPKRRDYVAGAVTLAAALCFGVVVPNVAILASVTLVAWVWIMLSCAWTLIEKAEDDPRLSRYVMAALFAAGIGATLLRVAVHALSERGLAAGWQALVTSASMGLLPVIGATVFLLMCVGRLKHNLEQVAATDHLTDLSNRRLLGSFGRDVFRRARAQGTGFSVAVIDIDRFKSVNDTFGHAVGDEVLVRVSRRLKHNIRNSDFIARSGGEEFVVVFAHPKPERVKTMVERLREIVAADRFHVGAAEISVTISAGVAGYSPIDDGFEDILRRADHALYRAKSHGRNRVELAEEPDSPAENVVTQRLRR